MNKRRLMALVAALCCLLSTTVYAGGGQILYDEGNGESLQGLLEEECAGLLKEFFRQLRLTLPNRKKWRRPSNITPTASDN